VVHLKGYGIKVFKIVAKDGDIEYWATNNLNMPLLQRLQFAEFGWTVIPSWTQAVLWRGTLTATIFSLTQHNHIGLAIRAFYV